LYGNRSRISNEVRGVPEPPLRAYPDRNPELIVADGQPPAYDFHYDRRANNAIQSKRLARIVWGAIGIGLCLNGLAVSISPRRFTEAEWLLWVAIIGPFVVFTVVLLAAQPSPRLRMVTVAAVGLYPSISYRLSSPLVLGGFDEHLHEQEVRNLLHGSGLFAPNPLLAVGPNYPGMELFTAGFIRATDVPIILGISLVPLLCRILLVLILYNGSLTVSPSRRVASLVVVFYATSPQFYFFNSQFAYQTMALSMGVGGLYLLRRSQLAGSEVTARRFWICGIAALIATVVTHHVTSWLVLAFLISWAMLSQSDNRRTLRRAAIVMGSATIGWTAVVAGKLIAYLGPVFTGDFRDLMEFVSGSAQRKVFTSSAGTAATPEWERIALVLYALCCTCAAVTCSCVLLSRAFRDRNRMLGLLGFLCLCSPITLAVHFIPAIADLGDRSSTFFFLPLALSCALVAMRDPQVSRRAARGYSSLSFRLVFLVSVTSVAYFGGVLLSSGPDWERLPGPYLAAADVRSQDSETLTAVRWAAAHLPPGSRIVADRTPADLLAGVAGMWPVSAPSKGLEPAYLYFSPNWTSYQTAIIKGLHIGYIYVDQRLSKSLPFVGFYFYPGETPQPERLSVEDLTKFSRVSGLDIVYHHGPVTIYSTAGFHVENDVSGFTGQHSMGLGWLGDGAMGVVAGSLIMLFRRRFMWVRAAVADLGTVGATLAAVAFLIFLGGALFGSRAMPGPGFSIGFAATVLIEPLLVNRKRFLPYAARLLRLDPVVVLGVLASIAGIALSIHSAWSTDVSIPDAILRAIAKNGNP
jgi:hypothetical protein